MGYFHPSLNFHSVVVCSCALHGFVAAGSRETVLRTEKLTGRRPHILAPPISRIFPTELRGRFLMPNPNYQTCANNLSAACTGRTDKSCPRSKGDSRSDSTHHIAKRYFGYISFETTKYAQFFKVDTRTQQQTPKNV